MSSALRNALRRVPWTGAWITPSPPAAGASASCPAARRLPADTEQRLRRLQVCLSLIYSRCQKHFRFLPRQHSCQHPQIRSMLFHIHPELLLFSSFQPITDLFLLASGLYALTERLYIRIQMLFVCSIFSLSSSETRVSFWSSRVKQSFKRHAWTFNTW